MSYSEESFSRSEKVAVELLEQLGRFGGNVNEFFDNLLAVECFLAETDGGAVLRSSEERGVDILCVYPKLEDGASVPVWLRRSAEGVADVLGQSGTVVKRVSDSGSAEQGGKGQYILLLRLEVADIGPIALSFVAEARDESDLIEKQRMLELSIGLLEVSETRPSQRQRPASIQRLMRAIETLSAINQQDRFASTAMSFCNEISSLWQCERVSIGFLKGRYVQLKAMSHTEDFSRKMKIISDIESAMEECFDQDIEIISPAGADASYVCRAADMLSKRHGPLAVLSLPLRRKGEAIGAVTLERSQEKAFSLEETETIRLTCEMCTPRLADLYEYDRWIGARAGLRGRRMFAKFLGPQHTWAKVAAIFIFACLMFLTFAKGQFKPESPFVLEATYQQIVPAPFDGYLKTVNIEIDGFVKGGETVLATLDTAELRLRLAAGKAEKHGYLKQEAAAMRDGQTAQAQIAKANADEVSARIDLLNYMIGQANIVSPLSGTVVKGDLKREIGAPVKTGDILFEVTPLESLRAELLVPEAEIFEIKVNQEGFLATASYPGQRINFVVERINPMAEVIKQRNVFRVRVRLLETYPWMRPGMEGVARVKVGKRHYIWIWTRKIINWVRMQLWF